MPTRRALIAAMVPAVVVFGIFWRWLDVPVIVAGALGALFACASLLVTRSVYDEAEAELEAWRRAAPDLAELDRRLPERTPDLDGPLARRASAAAAESVHHD